MFPFLTKVGPGEEPGFFIDTFRFFYDEASDIMKFRAAFRLGVGVGEVNVFATNDMA